jgi:hypothetical protein
MEYKMRFSIILLSGLLLVGCHGGVVDDEDSLNKEQRRDAKIGNLFGDDTLLFGGEDKPEAGSGIGVNQFLWQASLDTISFMPLRSADPFGGVILTEWYTAPEAPNERFKVDVRILDRQLRADGVKVSIHKQKQTKSGGWIDAIVDSTSHLQLEEAILTKARQLKVNEQVS